MSYFPSPSHLLCFFVVSNLARSCPYDILSLIKICIAISEIMALLIFKAKLFHNNFAENIIDILQFVVSIIFSFYKCTLATKGVALTVLVQIFQCKYM